MSFIYFNGIFLNAELITIYTFIYFIETFSTTNSPQIFNKEFILAHKHDRRVWCNVFLCRGGQTKGKLIIRMANLCLSFSVTYNDIEQSRIMTLTIVIIFFIIRIGKMFLSLSFLHELVLLRGNGFTSFSLKLFSACSKAQQRIFPWAFTNYMYGPFLNGF